jgi:hypothetical protein
MHAQTIWKVFKTFPFYVFKKTNVFPQTALSNGIFQAQIFQFAFANEPNNGTLGCMGFWDIPF